MVSKAVTQGNVSAMVNLGNLYGEGLGGEKNDSKAFDLYKKAAEKGDSAAQYNLAEYYRAGLATPRDLDKAIYWYEKSAAEGTIKAMDKLARIYRVGYKHIPANQALSDEWADKAAKARAREAVR